MAVEHGVDVIYVSNHGGRQLDHGAGSIDVLPEIVAATAGRAETIIDGGVPPRHRHRQGAGARRRRGGGRDGSTVRPCRGGPRRRAARAGAAARRNGTHHGTARRQHARRAQPVLRGRRAVRCARPTCSVRFPISTDPTTAIDGRHAGKPARPPGNPRRAASPAPAAGSRTASCSAIWPSCRSTMPSTSCCTASATSARCPVLEVTDPGSPVPHKLAPGADLRTDCARYAIFRDGIRQDDRTDIIDLWRDDLVTLPDRLRHHHRRRAGTRRRADPPASLGAAHRFADRAGRPVPRRPDRDHALAHRPAGDHRHAAHGALSVQPRCADPHRRSGGDRGRPRDAAVRPARCRPTPAGLRPGVLGLRRHPAKRGRECAACRSSSRMRRRTASSPICRPKR